MRLFVLAALGCAIVALVCAAVPTVVLGAGWTIWFLAAFVAFLVDLLTGYVVPINGNRTVVQRAPTQPIQ